MTTPLHSLVSSSVPSRPQKIIIKVGTSTLMSCDDATTQQTVNLAAMGRLVDVIAALKRRGHSVVVVSSAAVGFGCLKLKLKSRPTSVNVKQAVAAAGQSYLIRLYEDLFAVHELHVAQILLSRFDLSEKHRFANFNNALQELLRLDCIPIINENDCVSVEQLRFGDNDTLSALVAVAIRAEQLFILTDVDYLYTHNPRTHPDRARPVYSLTPEELFDGSTFNVGASQGGSEWGTGGMATKIVAARISAAAGIQCTLVNGGYPERALGMVERTLEARDVGSTFLPMTHSGEQNPSHMTLQRRFVLSLPARGYLLIDEGAVAAIRRKKSLLAAGIKAVVGDFLPAECVSVRLLLDGESADDVESLIEVAKCVVNLDSKEIDLIKGQKSKCYQAKLGFHVSPEIAFRANIIITAPKITAESSCPQLATGSDTHDD